MARIAFAGCWHANTGAAFGILDRLAKDGVHRVIHTGDFLYTGNTAKRFLHKVNRHLTNLGSELVLVRGNHDNPLLLNSMAKTGEKTSDGLVHLTEKILFAPDGTLWNEGRFRMAALGGARSVDWKDRAPGKEWWIDEVPEVAAIEKLSKESFDVLVTHDVPYPIPLDFLSREDIPTWWDLEDAEYHRRLLEPVFDTARPDLVVSGHMHTRADQFVTLANGHTFKSVVLDRGDWSSYPSEKDYENNVLIIDS